MAEKVILTQEGLGQIQEELRHLKEVKRLEIAEKLKEAISQWDLSENSEYDQARSDQAEVELRIQEIEEILKSYEIIAESQDAKQVKVNIGSEVSVKWLTEKNTGTKQTYKIVGAMEADVFDQKISNESPIGKALLGRKVGEIAKGKAPSGEFEMEITKIK